MRGRYVEIDTTEFKKFFESIKKAANGDFRKEFELFLEGIGNEFLRIVQDEIIRRQVMDTRLLLASFEKGADGNIWRLEEGGMVLEVGTNVNYAKYVNDGHWTNSRGVERRFVPGYWQGDRFIYDPTAKGGMMLKQHWVEGKHYFEGALHALDRIFPELLDAKLQEWIDNYFSG
ncbi:MAG: HK97 gp10 family phage protein [Lachnospiraceae bacterium]